MKYSHEIYTWTDWFGSIRHDWKLSCSKGGINFHASIFKEDNVTCGLEFHHIYPPHNDDSCPDHLNCPITGGRCWHDGTSMYAMDTLWPLIKPYLKQGDHRSIFSILEAEAYNHFYKIDAT